MIIGNSEGVGVLLANFLKYERGVQAKKPFLRGTKQIVLVNYLFRRPLIPFDFLKRIVTSNLHDKRNLKSVVFGLLKMWF